jgi:hypothetical protein
MIPRKGMPKKIKVQDLLSEVAESSRLRFERLEDAVNKLSDELNSRMLKLEKSIEGLEQAYIEE